MPNLTPLVLSLAIGAGVALDLGAVEPTKESLLAVWEESQKNDPQTLAFERIEPDRYRFQTERFPFDGVLRVLNVVIDDRNIEITDGFTLGMVEVKLEDAADQFYRDHSYSVGLWQTGNTFYFDQEAGRWLDSREWQQRAMEQVPFRGVWSWLFGELFWIVFLLVLVGILWWVARRANRQMKSAMAAQDQALAEQARAIKMTEEAVEISRDSNRLLRQIRDILRGQDRHDSQE